MALTTKKIDNYKMTLRSKAAAPEVAIISLYDGSNFIGNLSFVKDYPLPANKVHTGASGYWDVYYHISMFDAVQNMLRYERPLEIRMHADQISFDFANTMAEPVGEQEGVGAARSN